MFITVSYQPYHYPPNLRDEKGQIRPSHGNLRDESNRPSSSQPHLWAALD